MPLIELCQKKDPGRSLSVDPGVGDGDLRRRDVAGGVGAGVPPPHGQNLEYEESLKLHPRPEFPKVHTPWHWPLPQQLLAVHFAGLTL
mmetsp:Transcript_160071/g.283586  ORF Transcript_160071/g.283586 Transcript_160071/m.283586 type:complete len:88 (-) Transcript_160071:124-387(-)